MAFDFFPNAANLDFKKCVLVMCFGKIMCGSMAAGALWLGAFNFGTYCAMYNISRCCGLVKWHLWARVRLPWVFGLLCSWAPLKFRILWAIEVYCF